MLTQKRLKELMDYNKQTGKFVRKSTPVGRGRNQCVVGEEVGYLHEGYLCTNVAGTSYGLSRLAFLYIEGIMPDKMVDHINGITTDNSWKNLRKTDNTGNMQNQALPKNNKSGTMGVRWTEERNKWRVMIGKKHLGYFKNKKEAIACRKLAEKKYGYHENHGRPTTKEKE